MERKFYRPEVDTLLRDVRPCGIVTVDRRHTACHRRRYRLIFRQDFHSAFKTIMVDMLTVLAIVEVLRTALAYFTEGRVKVTYIIDTVIVTVLTEVMAFWYKNIDWNEVAMTIALVLSLAFVRIIAVRFSPAGLRKEL